MKSESVKIQTHNISEILKAMGMDDQHSELHVIAAENSNVGLPIPYPFRSDHFAFHIITEGQLLVKLNLINYPLKKQSVLMLHPNTVRQYLEVSPDCRVVSISFTPKYLSGTDINKKNIDAFDFLLSLVNPLISVSIGETDILVSLLNILKYKMENDIDLPFHDDVIINLFTAFIYEIGAYYKSRKENMEIKGTRKEELTFRFLKLLPQHFVDQRSVQLYATMLNITPKYLSQAVKDITGKTAGEQIDDMVSIEAKILLTNPSLTIAQIAENLNFSDQFSFSKFFKKQFGMSPSKYRQTS
jgi:AraC family transcriptional activator of pobA